ncbi:MAG: hypothetical protein Q9203_003030 [Teloschistes exilis]
MDKLPTELGRQYKSEDDWKERIRSNTNHWTRKVNTDYKAKQLDMEYVGSKGMLESQTCMKNVRYGKKQCEEAIPSMPNLQHLTVTIGDALTPASIHRFRKFYSVSPIPFDDIANGHAHGVPQLRAFYHAAFKYGLKLKSFACKGISWQLFKSPRKDLVKLASVLSKADSMVLHLSASYGRGTGPEMKQCQQYLKNGKVSDLLRQMEHLQNLELHMDQGGPVFAWEQRHVVRSSTLGQTDSHLSGIHGSNRRRPRPLR